MKKPNMTSIGFVVWDTFNNKRSRRYGKLYAHRGLAAQYIGMYYADPKRHEVREVFAHETI